MVRNSKLSRRSLLLISCLLLFFCTAMAPAASPGPPVTPPRNTPRLPVAPLNHHLISKALRRLTAGNSQDYIIEWDRNPVEKEARGMRFMGARGAEILSLKARRFKELKQKVLSTLPLSEFQVLRDFSHLPMAFIRFRSPRALIRLLEHTEVTGVYENRLNYPSLAESLPLIHQPEVNSMGYVGEGSTVAVLDTGLDYENPAFGPCTEPGSPSECKVVAAEEMAADDGMLDDPFLEEHGTNVSAIVLGVAPQARIAALDVFAGEGALDTDIIKGINWALENRDKYGIVAINLSLGDRSRHAYACTGSVYATPVAEAWSAGILTVAAAGNDGYTNGIAEPACAPGVVSVGAVYDEDLGPIQWGMCTDYSPEPDLVTCFSNSADILTLLAPGALITAAGMTKGGTSQASPHVAGAVAVLRAAYPNETLNQTVSRLIRNGVDVTDPRNGRIKPRLDLLGAVTGITDPSLSLSPGPSPTMAVVESWGSPGPAPYGLAFEGRYLWNSDGSQDKIYRLDTSGNILEAFGSPGPSPGPLAFDGEYLWNIDRDEGKIHKIDLSGKTIGTMDAPGPKPIGLAHDGTHLWYADADTRKIYGLDDTGSVLESFDSPAPSPGALAFDGTYLWHVDRSSGRIYQLDLVGQVIGTFDSPGGQGLAFDGDNLWQCNSSTATISKLGLSGAVHVLPGERQLFTIANQGGKELILGSLSIAGENATDFHLENDTCSGQTLLPLGECTFDVLFSPNSPGWKTADLALPSNDPEHPVVYVLLSGRLRPPGVARPLPWLIPLLFH